MTQDVKHSPLPWRKAGFVILDAKGDVITDASDDLIVTACNSHYELIEVLEVMVAEYCDYTIRNNLGDPEKQQTIKQARNALAKVKP